MPGIAARGRRREGPPEERPPILVGTWPLKLETYTLADAHDDERAQDSSPLVGACGGKKQMCSTAASSE